MKYTIHCDGLCEPNPSDKATWAFVVYDAADELVTSCSGVMAGHQTNNTAEYRAMIEALAYAHEDDSNDYLILTDSQLVVKQLNGEWQVKSENLRSWYGIAKDLMEPHMTIGWVRGSENKADGLTRLAYAELTGLYPHPRRKGDWSVKFTPTSELPDLFKEQLNEPPF